MAYKKLKSIDKAWNSAKDEFGDSTGGFETVPSGNYVIGKINCEFDEDALVIKRKQTILEGEHAGFVINDRMNLDPEVSPRGVEFCLKWFNLLGYEIDTFSADLDDTLEEINGNATASYGASVKEKNGFNNVFYNKVVDEGEEGSDTGSTPSDTNTTGREEMPDIDAMKTRKLKKLIVDEQLDVEIEDDMDDDDLKDAIEAAWEKPAKEEKKEEKKLSRKEKAAAAKAEKTTSRRGKKTDKTDDSKLTKDLFNIGDAFGIDVEESMDLKELKKVLKDYTFKKKDLEKSEIKVFEDADLESVLK